MRFARRRFGHYEVIDFLAVLFGYAISGERTLEEFYERLLPFAQPFMALFDREKLPSRSALSRFLASVSLEATETLRTLFLADLLARPLDEERHTGTLVDRAGNAGVVFDIDGTREAARQRARPQAEELPTPQRRLNKVCAAFLHGAQARGGRPYAHRCLAGPQLPMARQFRKPRQWTLPRGTAPGADGHWELVFRHTIFRRPRPCCGWTDNMEQGLSSPIWQASASSCAAKITACWIRNRSKAVCTCQLTSSSVAKTSGLVRQLYDCPDVPVGKTGDCCRVLVATHPATEKKSRIGHTRKGVVYELFFTDLPQDAFTASDVVALYLHRGAFEPVLSDEDQEQDPDRWCSHSPAGQEVWQIVSQWVWNLRLELGHQLSPTPLRTTEFAPPVTETTPQQAPVQGYGKPAVALPWKAGRFCGQDFALQPDGTLACPASKTLRPTEQRREADGSLRVLYSARILDCRGCSLRQQCQWYGEATTKPRRISVLLHPLPVGPAPLLWRDWSRREHRRACRQFVRHQRVEVSLPPPALASPRQGDVILSRAQRAHSRLSWAERLARNARDPTAGQVTIKLFGIPERFAASLGLATETPA